MSGRVFGNRPFNVDPNGVMAASVALNWNNSEVEHLNGGIESNRIMMPALSLRAV